MIIIDEPNIPHKKKKDSNISKADKKSKHKHIYDKVVIFFYTFQKSDTPQVVNWHPMKRTYCSICGKMNESFSIRDVLGQDKDALITKYPDASLIKLKKGKSPLDIKNINEVL